VPYLPGTLTIERVIRPGAVEELLCLIPENGGKSIVFDLDKPKTREGLCNFIKECEAAKFSIKLQSNGSIAIPVDMEARFSFYRDFYGLTQWTLIGVELLQTNDKKDEKKSSGEDNKEVKKFDPEPPPEPKKPKVKISKKLEPRPLNVVPASIVWIAGGAMQAPSGPQKSKPTTSLPLSVKLGGHKVGLSAYSLGRPASGLKSLGGMSR
jgi:hypothetical protein